MDIASWIENHFMVCSFKETFGIDCLGCGLQRSIVCLARGDFYGSVRYYPPLLFLISYAIMWILYISFNNLISTFYFLRATFTILTIVFLSYIMKIIFYGLQI